MYVRYVAFFFALLLALPVDALELSYSAQDVLNKVNTARAEEGLDPLRVDLLLAAAAQKKAEDMATRGYFSHTTPEGKSPWKWLREEEYAFSRAAENIAVRYSSADSLVKGWLRSPGHQANIIDQRLAETGIGIARGAYKGRKTIFVVQLFATP